MTYKQFTHWILHTTCEIPMEDMCDFADLIAEIEKIPRIHRRRAWKKIQKLLEHYVTIREVEARLNEDE